MNTTYTIQLPQKEVTARQIENDPRFAEILDNGYGNPSANTEQASHAIANLINWWRCCTAGGETIPNMLSDVDDLVHTLRKFKTAVQQDNSLALANPP